MAEEVKKFLTFPVRLPRAMFLDFTWASMLRREISVLGALALFANRQGRCFPSVERLGNVAGVQSRRKVQKALRELERLGLVRSLGRRPGKGMTVYEIAGLSSVSVSSRSLPPYSAVPQPVVPAPGGARVQRPSDAETSAPVDAQIILNEINKGNSREVVADASLISDGAKLGLDQRTMRRLELEFGASLVSKALSAAAEGVALGRVRGTGAGWVVEALRRGFNLESFAVAGRKGVYKSLSPEGKAARDRRIAEMASLAQRERLAHCEELAALRRAVLEIPAEERLALRLLAQERETNERFVVGFGRVDPLDCVRNGMAELLARKILELRAGKAGA